MANKQVEPQPSNVTQEQMSNQLPQDSSQLKEALSAADSGAFVENMAASWKVALPDTG